MFIEKEELYTAIHDYTLDNITTDDVVVESAILAAIAEMEGYLAVKYDTNTIFSAKGTERNIIVLEHCKSIAVWYIIRLSNADVLFDKAKIYYDNAIGWLKDVAGLRSSGGSIQPNLPIKKIDDSTSSQFGLRGGSRRKFVHSFDE